MGLGPAELDGIRARHLSDLRPVGERGSGLLQRTRQSSRGLVSKSSICSCPNSEAGQRRSRNGTQGSRTQSRAAVVVRIAASFYDSSHLELSIDEVGHARLLTLIFRVLLPAAIRHLVLFVSL